MPELRSRARDTDFSLIDLPRTEPIDDPPGYLRAAVRWHFSPETGSPYWLKRAEMLDFNPLTDVKTFEDLSLFPNIVDELRDVDVRDLVPAGYGPNPPIPAVYESGGTTGAPKRAIFMPDWEEQFTAWYAADLLEQPGLGDSGLLMVGPSGPHMFGQMQRRVAAVLNSVLFTIDLDPRWVKKLVARGAVDEAAAYVDHILEQAGYILRTQDVTVLTTTPPLLQAIARDDDLVDVIEGNRCGLLILLTVDRSLSPLSRIYVPAIYVRTVLLLVLILFCLMPVKVLNKIDAISIEELDLLYKIPNSVPISSNEWLNVDELIDKMWEALDLVRVYTKPRGQPPDYSAPVVLRRGKCSVEDFCNAIHKEIAKQMK